MGWHVEVFGSARLRAEDGTPVPLTRTQRRLIARLALGAGGTVGQPALVDALWDGDPPANARAALQNQISRIRAAADQDLITTHRSGYRLHATVDAEGAASAVERAERALGTGNHARAFEAADGLCQLETADAYADLADHPEARAAREILSAARRVAEDLRAEAALGLGRIGWAVVEAQRLAVATPHDAGRAVRLARALDANGRRGDALAALSRHARCVRLELGIEPVAEISREQARLLAVPDAGAPDVRRPFVGRDTEIERITEAVRSGHAVWVWGEPGIGVSRCLLELRSRLIAEGLSVGRTSCAVHAGAPGDPLLDLVDDLGMRPDLTRGVIGAFLDAIRSRAAHRPVALLVDDWHQAGPSSRAALRDAAALPGVSVVAGSHVPPTAQDGVTVELRGLDEATIPELFGPEEAATADPVELRRLTAGNPLLIEVVLTAPDAATGSFADAPGSTSAPMLERVLQTLTGELSRRERDLLDVAAVAGDLAPRELVLEAWAGSEDLHWPTTVVEELDGTVRFRHAALRGVVYHRIPSGRRAEIHHALGSTAQRHGLSAATVASHLVEAAELDRVGAYEAARRAGQDATRAGAHRDAAAWFGQAATIAGAEPEQQRDWLAARIAEGDALRLAGDRAHEDVLVTAAEEAITLGDHQLLADAAYALLQLGATTDVDGPDPRILRIINTALATAPDQLAAPLRASASLAWSLTGTASTSRELFLAAERDAITATARRRTLPFAYMALGLPGDLPEREQAGRELLDLGRDADDPVARFEAYHLLFSTGLQRGDGRGIRRSLAAMSDLVEDVGDVGRRWQLLYQRATIAHLEGEDAACEQLSTDALTMFHDISPNRALAAYFGQIFALRVTQGRTAELADALRGLVADQPGIPAWNAALALSLASTGQAADARTAAEHIQLARNLAEPDVTWLACHLVAGRAVARIGDRAAARELLTDLSPWSGLGCWQGTCSYGPVDTVLAMLHTTLGDDEAAARHHAMATSFARSLGAAVYVHELAQLRDAADPPPRRAYTD